MLTYQSDLKTNTFYIIKSCCELIVPKHEFDPIQVFLNYPIDVEYSVKERGGGKTFRVLIEIRINYPEKSPGYSIMVEGMGDFSIDSEQPVTEVQKEHLINYTAIERSIEYIRGYVSNMTAQYPLGKYIFQGINMEMLHKAKLEQKKKIRTSESKLRKKED